LKTIVRICAVLSIGLFAAACVGSTSPESAGATSEEERVGDAEEALGTSYVFVTYYKEAAHLHEVGECTFPSICSGATKTCTGVQTAYHTQETVLCH